MNIIISNTAGVPIYEQIKEQIKAAIFNGEVAEGEMLPSIRGLAKDLQISVITTMRAYADLEAEGFVTNIQGKGCIVKPQNADLLNEQRLKESRSQFEQRYQCRQASTAIRKRITQYVRFIIKGARQWIIS